MATIGTHLYTWLHGKYVGTDRYGNRYYQEKRNPRDRRRKRWVMYKGRPEATKVPPEWHGWLHHMTDLLPDQLPTPDYVWEQEHQPNLTGTANAYLPPGHILKGGDRQRSGGDYVPWQP